MAPWMQDEVWMGAVPTAHHLRIEHFTFFSWVPEGFGTIIKVK